MCDLQEGSAHQVHGMSCIRGHLMGICRRWRDLTQAEGRSVARMVFFSSAKGHSPQAESIICGDWNVRVRAKKLLSHGLKLNAGDEGLFSQ